MWRRSRLCTMADFERLERLERTTEIRRVGPARCGKCGMGRYACACKNSSAHGYAYTNYKFAG
ncbi:MAG: hypothetical protein IKP06_04125 [Elusimicrobiaceae bacterium]|nr:hypothetical protein [Elusimicrobiaceae bacterium]